MFLSSQNHHLGDPVQFTCFRYKTHDEVDKEEEEEEEDGGGEEEPLIDIF